MFQWVVTWLRSHVVSDICVLGSRHKFSLSHGHFSTLIFPLYSISTGMKMFMDLQKPSSFSLRTSMERWSLSMTALFHDNATLAILPLASSVIQEVTESWVSSRYWGLKKLRVCVLHLALKRTISTWDHISFHHYCHCHHLQVIYGKRCRHREQRERARVGDRNGDDDDNSDSEGGEGIQTVSSEDILFYDWLNQFLISPTICNLSFLSWPTNKKSLNCYCSSVTFALSRSWSKKCNTRREREEGTSIDLKTSRNSWASWVHPKTRVTIHQQWVHIIGNVQGSRRQDWLENGWHNVKYGISQVGITIIDRRGNRERNVQQGNRWVRSWYRACDAFNVKCGCFTIVNKMPLLKIHPYA